MERLNETLDQCGGLTATPVVLTRVATMLANNAPDLAEIESVVKQDPALVSAVFKMANAAFEAPSSRIAELHQAIVWIGSKRLIRMVSTHEAGRIVPADASIYGLEYPQLWRNSVGGAIAAERLAQTHAPEDAGACYVAGLLRDIGKLALITAFGDDSVSGLGAPTSEAPSDFAFAEREAFGFDHAALGAALAERWQLPPRVVAAIRRHHDPAAPGDPEHDVLIDVVHAADMICLWGGFEAGDDGTRYQLADHVRSSIGLGASLAERIAAETWIAVTTLEQTTRVAG